MFENRGPRIILISTLKESFRRTLCVSMYVFSYPTSSQCLQSNQLTPSLSGTHSLRVHTTSRPSSPTVGLPPRLWCTSKCTLRHCSTVAHPGGRYAFELVRICLTLNSFVHVIELTGWMLLSSLPVRCDSSEHSRLSRHNPSSASQSRWCGIYPPSCMMSS